MEHQVVSNAQAQATRREVLQGRRKQALNIPAGAGVGEWSEHWDPCATLCSLSPRDRAGGRTEEKMQEKGETISEEKRTWLFGRYCFT